MTPKKALAIYNSGPQAVVQALCDFSGAIDSLREEKKALEIKIAKLSKNPSNSSKRPSSDDVTKPKTTRKKGNRSIGGQPGHPRNERPLFPKNEIHESHSYIFVDCPVCGGEVDMTDGKPKIIQQMKLPEVPLIKEEHSSYPVWCENCQEIHYKPFPPEVVKEGLFKTDLTALVAYMKHVCHASFSTIRKFIRDVLGEKVSRGYLRKVIEKVSNSLEKPYAELLERLPLETNVNVDETGHKENKEKFWTWVFKADLYVLFKIDKSRGSQVLIEVLGEEFNGAIGCDYYSSYRKYMKDFNITVQFCLAHLIREIRFLTTFPDAKTKVYGKKLLDEVKNLFKIIHEYDGNQPGSFKKALEQTKGKITIAALDAPSKINKKGKEEKREAQNMANRFRKHGDAYFEFITTPGIDPTNNVAEQAIRFIVIDRHVTQGTRSEKGRRSNERIWTVIGTCAIQGRSAFNFILEAVKALFHDQPAPSLLPNTS